MNQKFSLSQQASICQTRIKNLQMSAERELICVVLEKPDPFSLDARRRTFIGENIRVTIYPRNFGFFFKSLRRSHRAKHFEDSPRTTRHLYTVGCFWKFNVWRLGAIQLPDYSRVCSPQVLAALFETASNSGILSLKVRPCLLQTGRSNKWNFL